MAKIIVRLGSHAEKEYLEKTAQFLDGAIIGANLAEATPGATSSLIIRLCGPKRGLVYYIDPMTYAYGSDLEWIMSDKVVKGESVREYKRSYRALAEKLGGVFNRALKRGKAITPEDFKAGGDLEKTCRSVVEYQRERINMELAKEPDLREFAEDVPRPAAVFAPYFYLQPGATAVWMRLVLDLARQSKILFQHESVQAVLCADVSFLKERVLLQEFKRELRKTGVDGVWFWFSRLFEESADIDTLKALISLVADLGKDMEVYNMHGGFFSLALCTCGLTGISHGIGYGEQKDVVPVIGQSTPTVRFYLPPIRKRLGVPQIERCFDALEIRTRGEFFRKVCNCVVCKGVLSDGLRQFSAFGEMRRSAPMAKRLSQTPAAAKRCRFHFLITRIKERNWIRENTKAQVIRELQRAEEAWGSLAPIQNECRHLGTWQEALS